MAIINPKTISKLVDTADIKRMLDDPGIFKKLYRDHQMDALSYSMRHQQRYVAREQEDEEELQKIFETVGRYIDPENLPNVHDLMFETEAIDAFLWGPNYEFTGFVKTAEMADRFQRSPTGRYRPRRSDYDVDFTLEYCLHGDLVPAWDAYKHGIPGAHYYYDPFGRPAARPHMLARFESYLHLDRYGELFGKRGSPYSLELAGLFQSLRVNETAYAEWVKAMCGEKYKFGYGCLRDGQDHYDPFGVLADLNGVTWVWDRREDAYKPKGSDPYTLSSTQIREMLSVAPTAKDAVVNSFLSLFPLLMDRCTSFAQVKDTMEAAWKIIDERQTMVRYFRRNELRMPRSFIGVNPPDSADAVVMERHTYRGREFTFAVHDDVGDFIY